MALHWMSTRGSFLDDELMWVAGAARPRATRAEGEEELQRVVERASRFRTSARDLFARFKRSGERRNLTVMAEAVWFVKAELRCGTCILCFKFCSHVARAGSLGLASTTLFLILRTGSHWGL